MAQLVVRNLDPEVKLRLKDRAVQNGRSLEAEVREILGSSVAAAANAPEPSVGTGTVLAREMAQFEVTEEDWVEFDRAIAEGRKGWRLREVDFGE